jgi:hypothetical protein
MRSTTLLAHLWRVSILAVALLALPQLASAQLPLETKSLKIQATTGTDAVTMTASTVSAPYTLNFPAAIGTPGGMLYVKTSATGTAQLAFATATGIANGWSPIWDGTDVVWVDPNSATNPNWSRAGNAISTEGLLGTTTAGGSIKVITGASQERMLIGATGAISINTSATEGGATTTIGRAAGHTTVVDGTFDVNGATTIDGATIGITGVTTVTGATTIVGATDINATGTAATNINTGAAGTTTIGSTGGTITTIGSLGHTGTSSFTGNVTLASTASSLVARNSDGTAASDGVDGNVLVSAGPNVTPRWKNLNDAIGIRAAGNVSVTVAANATAVINVPNLASTDAILITLQGSGSTVVATVTNRTDGAAGSFIATFSGSYVGVVNYLVIKTL